MIDTPAVRDFREYVENIPSQRDRILIKLLYLTAAKVSEVTRKTTPYDLEKQSSKPYGQYLTYSFGDYEKQHVLLIKLAVAQRRVKRKNNLPHFKIVALPTLLTYEPWTRDLLVWIRDLILHETASIPLSERGSANSIQRFDLSAYDDGESRISSRVTILRHTISRRIPV
jgi:hypothetical protein